MLRIHTPPRHAVFGRAVSGPVFDAEKIRLGFVVAVDALAFKIAVEGRRYIRVCSIFHLKITSIFSRFHRARHTEGVPLCL